MTKLSDLLGTPPAQNLNDLSDVSVPSPTDGDVLTYDAGAWIAAAASGGGGGGLISVQRFTSNGTWTKPAGCERVLVICQGGGGGGGGTIDQNQTGHGGQSGAFTVEFVTSGLGSTETVTVGAGGAGNNGNGSSGGTSSFGTHVSALGGSGGRIVTPAVSIAFDGFGMRGGRGRATSAGNGGAAGANTGAGGGGAKRILATTNHQGGAGGSGYVIVISYGE